MCCGSWPGCCVGAAGTKGTACRCLPILWPGMALPCPAVGLRTAAEPQQMRHEPAHSGLSGNVVGRGVIQLGEDKICVNGSTFTGVFRTWPDGSRRITPEGNLAVAAGGSLRHGGSATVASTTGTRRVCC